MLETVSHKLLTTVAPRTTAENAEIVRLKAKLKAIVDAEIVSAVTKGYTEAERASFLQRLRDAGSEAYKDTYQQIYDRWQGEREARE